MIRSAPNPYRDLGPGRLDDGALRLAIPLSAQGVLGPGLSVLPEGIAPRDGTRGHTQGPALPHLVDGSVPSPPHLLVNVSLVLVVKSAIVVVPLPAGGVTRLTTVPGRVVEALDTDPTDVAGAPRPLHGVENRASQGHLPRKAGGAKKA